MLDFHNKYYLNKHIKTKINKLKHGYLKFLVVKAKSLQIPWIRSLLKERIVQNVILEEQSLYRERMSFCV